MGTWISGNPLTSDDEIFIGVLINVNGISGDSHHKQK